MVEANCSDDSSGLWWPVATAFQIGVLPLYHRDSDRYGTTTSFHATTTRARYTEKGSASIWLLGVARPADDSRDKGALARLGLGHSGRQSKLPAHTNDRDSEVCFRQLSARPNLQADEAQYYITADGVGQGKQ